MYNYFYKPVPKFPDEFNNYCHNHGFSLTTKKRYIIEHILSLPDYTDIVTIQLYLMHSCSSVSITSIYNTLQWLIAHKFVLKDFKEDNATLVYFVNKDHLTDLNIQIY